MKVTGVVVETKTYYIKQADCEKWDGAAEAIMRAHIDGQSQQASLNTSVLATGVVAELPSCGDFPG